MSGHQRAKKALKKQTSERIVELERLQATYSLTLAAFLLEQHEMVTQQEAQPGEEINYFIPLNMLHKISESELRINTNSKEGKIGAEISLILAKPMEEEHGEEEAANNSD